MTDVLLCNASYQVLSRIDWQRAITLVVVDEADVIEAHPTRVVRSQHLTIPMPTIIALRVYRHIAHRPGAEKRPSFAQIKLRDARTCAYCGQHGDTIDHVVPRSRGGLDTWDNLVCACRSCNNRKADRTPVEAGMRLLWAPRPVIPDAADQQLVWDALATAS